MEAIARDTELYRDAFETLAERRRSEPEWLRVLRRSAFERFCELGFPGAKLEAWKYTNVAPIADRNWSLPGGPSLHSLEARATTAPLDEMAAEIVFVNGRFSRELSRGASSRPELIVSSLADVLARDPDRLQSRLSKVLSEEPGAFASWNTAFFEDGAYVEITPGAVLTRPIHLVFSSASEVRPAVASPRVLIVAGRQSQCTIVERYRGVDGAIALTNAVTEISVGDGAVVQHVKVQREGDAARHVHAIACRQERSSQFVSHNLALGGALARTDLSVLFDGEGSECTLNGLFVGGGSQHLDNHTLIDHARPHCGSRELYKGILDGRARGVFHGKIIVRPDAQKTDAMQTNKNLLLSREALVNSTPALEIFADDVKCKHGSTIGQLDAAALFYLRSRGLDEREARSLLTYAFAADVTERIPVRAVRDEVEAHVGRRLARPAEAA